jgi:hypothetical protein
MSNQHASKYRPSLSVIELKYILSLAKAEARPEVMVIAKNLSNKLEVFSLKMHLGLVTASHTAAENKETISDKLGLSDSTPEARRLAAYGKYLLNPDFCSPSEMRMVQTYMYEHNLMSQEEEAAYESSMIVPGGES